MGETTDHELRELRKRIEQLEAVVLRLAREHSELAGVAMERGVSPTMADYAWALDRIAAREQAPPFVGRGK